MRLRSTITCLMPKCHLFNQLKHLNRFVSELSLLYFNLAVKYKFQSNFNKVLLTPSVLRP